MELRLSLNKGDGFWVDGSHPVFKNTEFEGLFFKIKIRLLSRTEIRKIREEVEAEGKTKDQDCYLEKTCRSQIIDWVLFDEKGGPIVYSEDAKAVLVEHFPDFTNRIAAACLRCQAEAEEARAEERKNCLTSGGGGLQTGEVIPDIAPPAGRSMGEERRSNWPPAAPAGKSGRSDSPRL